MHLSKTVLVIAQTIWVDAYNVQHHQLHVRLIQGNVLLCECNCLWCIEECVIDLNDVFCLLQQKAGQINFSHFELITAKTLTVSNVGVLYLQTNNTFGI